MSMKRKCSYISTLSPFILVEIAHFGAFGLEFQPCSLFPNNVLPLMILARIHPFDRDCGVFKPIMLLSCEFHSEILSLILVP